MGDSPNTYWEDQKKQPNFQSWLESLEGSVMCNCGHGCRNWTADNGAKALKIIQALQSGADIATLDAIVQKHVDAVSAEIHIEVIARDRAERKKKSDGQTD